MKKIKFLFLSLALFSLALLGAADKLAVAEPVGKGGIKKADIEAFWGILESSIKSDEYKLISRSALKQMLTEIGLTSSSGLTNLNSSQKAKMGQLETVKYILVSEIAKFGSRFNCTMRIIDSSTGEIDTARTANVRFKNLDELADKIEAVLEKMLSDNKKLMRSAILAPRINAGSPPSYLAQDFNTRMENTLLNAGVRLQNLQSVDRILRKNNIGRLSELEPKMCRKVGELLEVQYLIQATITRFEIVRKPYYVSETGARGVRSLGYLEGNIRIIATATGEIVASLPFEEQVNFRYVSRAVTRDWTVKDYGKYLIKSVMQKSIVPQLLNVKALKNK